MSTGLAVVDREGRRLGNLTWAGLLTRLAIVVPVLVVTLWTGRVAQGAPWWPGGVLVLLAVVTAAWPDSMVGLVTIAAAATWWVLAAAEAPVAASLVTAGALLLFHLATAHAATGPPGRVADRASVVRLAAGGALVLAGTCVVASVAVAAEGRVVVGPVVLGAALLAVGALPLLTLRR